MEQRKDIPAFPVPNSANLNEQEGMTLRQYAAIKLQVPNSGTEWLDAMIREAKRDNIAAEVVSGVYSSDSGSYWTNPRIATEAYALADALLASREK